MGNESKPVVVELGIELLVEFLLFLLPYGAEQMGLPHNFWFGLGCWIVATAIAIRMFWISPWWDTRLSRLQKSLLSLVFVAILVGIFLEPVLKAHARWSADRQNDEAMKPTSGQIEQQPPSLSAQSRTKPKGKKAVHPSNQPIIQPTYSVTNPTGSIVNQNSTNYGSQVVNNAPPSRVLSDGNARKFQIALEGRSGTISIFPDGTDIDVVPLAKQLCDLFQGHGAAHCIGVPGSDAMISISLPSQVNGIHCYLTDEHVNAAFKDSGLECMYESSRLGEPGLTTVAPAILIGNAQK
jgi:hypothetical protein